MDQGFQGSLYEVFVINANEFTNVYQIRYIENIDAATGENVMDEVPKERLRPSPQEVYPLRYPYNMGDQVDYYKSKNGEAQSGFWPGIVIEADQELDLYVVQLANQEQEQEPVLLWGTIFDIRPHQNFEEGVLVSAPPVPLPLQ